VTDVMPLKGENRALESFGLKVLNKTRRPGLRAILESSGTSLGDIDTQAIGFRIGPRLNAAGRLASAEIAFKAVTAATPEEAIVAAAELERLNRERQSIFAESYAEARVIAKEMLNDAKVLVVHAEHWLPGIVGLIAGRLVNDFGLPAFALTKVGEHYVGSGRTAGGLHLVEAMNSCGDVFIRKGGHPQACGLTIISESHIEQFRSEMNTYANGVFGAAGVDAPFEIDAQIETSQAKLGLAESLLALEPFGEGNRPPVFALCGVTVMAAETMGATKTHLRLTVLGSGGGVVKCVGFSMGNRAAGLPMGAIIDVAVEIGINVWNGRREAQLRIVDLRQVIYGD
ncbi:MAG: DHHA1 domain-containing protein, partial [Candidatus Uhrbacteria bacterium]|nr:DHHA1 domain-containing protein [Candidatus Uhrbacteria bacterium]